MIPCMDEDMKRKIDMVLDRVKDPESDLPISRLGVIERFRYNEAKKELYIFANFLSHRPGCLTCVGVAAAVIDGIKRRLLVELEKEFPELTILFV
jgi:metal-sulfur cluster biosynthetic enzyme